jgi:hypothetical protein
MFEYLLSIVLLAGIAAVGTTEYETRASQTVCPSL